MELLGPDRESIGREKAGILRTGKPGDRQRPDAAAKRARPRRRDRRRPVALRATTSTSPATSSSGPGPGAGRRYSGLAYPALRGANQLVNASGVLAALEALREQLPVTAQAVRNGLALVELPGRFQIVPGPAHAGAGRGAQPAFGGGADGQPGRHGLLPDHPRRLRRHGRQGPGAHAGAHRRRWSTAGISPTCPRRAPAPAQALAGRAGRRCQRAARTLAQHPCRPRWKPCRRPSPRQTPLIESSSSDRSTRWVAFCRTACPAFTPNTCNA